LSAEQMSTMLTECVGKLLAMQEGEGKDKGEGAEWPYEGVYRVGGTIPIGYRVGGTSITSIALMRADGYDTDAARQDAVRRASGFVIAQREHPLMSVKDYDAGYDVRGWGYTYALQFLLEWRSRASFPADQKEGVDGAITWYIDAIQNTEIPTSGGWNYARRPGAATVSPASPFMTGPTLQALFEAKKQGFAVDAAVVARGLDALERMRTVTGSITYSGDADPTDTTPEPVAGSVGRMMVLESTLQLAGRGSIERVRGSLDSFFTHWEWLDKRRAQTGTHIPPYGVAPYYFYYAHYHAAQAIELLPTNERKEYRRRLSELLLRNRLEDGTWNDRVFPRSANFGTSMAVMSYTCPSVTPARWGEAAKDVPPATP
jgi:hypothetical protein